MMTFLNMYNTYDRSKYEKYAMEYLVGDLLDKNLHGPEKTREIYAMDFESQMRTAFVPSMFYTFMYVSKSDANNPTPDFYDRVPLILCTGFDGAAISGINFNLIPNNARAAILDYIIKSFPTFYRIGMNGSVNNKFGGILVNQNTLKEFINSISGLTKLNIGLAYRHYAIGGVINPRMIEYDMWKYIPFLSFKDATRGGSLAEIQKRMIVSSAE